MDWISLILGVISGIMELSTQVLKRIERNELIQSGRNEASIKNLEKIAYIRNFYIEKLSTSSLLKSDVINSLRKLHASKP